MNFRNCFLRRMTTQHAPPLANEIEISVFGPGYGEALLIHVGNGRWVTIDSCIDETSGRPAVLSYLEKLGVDPQTAIDVVIASHWHDDHVRGLKQLFSVATSAHFVCSSALAGSEFLALAKLYERPASRIPKGPTELDSCFREVVARSKLSGRQVLKFAMADRVLWELDSSSDSATTTVALTSLSPSDEMNRRSIMFMVQAMAAIKRGAHENRLVESYPNDVAVALRLDIGKRSILLGSDLEEEGDNLVGWSAVLDGQVARKSKSMAFKVAHHGSLSGHHARVWADLLESNPLSLLTPFRFGKHRIPTSADRARILSLTKRAYISAHPERSEKVARKASRKAEDLINRTAHNRRRALGALGHIRWRAPIFDANSEGTVELFNGAMALADISR